MTAPLVAIALGRNAQAQGGVGDDVEPETPAFAVRLTLLLSQRRREPYARGVCAGRTATKYRNTTTATRPPAGLGAALPCSVANMVAVA